MAKRTCSRGSIMKILMQAAIDDPLCAEWRAWDLMIEANKITEFMQNDSDPIYIAFSMTVAMLETVIMYKAAARY